MISLIAATNQDGIIGLSNRLPWSFPEDLKRFKALTSGGTVIMGRNTFDSIGRPLPNRRNIVLSRSMKAQDKVEIFSSLASLLIAIVAIPNVWVIGGAEIYRQFLAADVVNTLDLTLVDFPIEDKTDAIYFPQIPSFFKEISSVVNEKDSRLKHIVYHRS